MFILWIVLSFIVAFIGSGRKIGFGFSLLLSLLFSPLIGLIIVAISKSKSSIEFENKMLDLQKLQTEAAHRLSPPPATLSEKLETIRKLRDSGEISMQEFQQKRDELMKSL